MARLPGRCRGFHRPEDSPSGIAVMVCASRAAACSTTWTQRLGFGFGQVAVQGQEPAPGEEGLPGHRCGQPRGVDPEVYGGEVTQAGGFAGADGVLDPGVDPVSCVDIGGLSEPALGARGPVRGLQGVPAAVPGLEQGQLGRQDGVHSRFAKTRIAVGQAAELGIRARTTPSARAREPMRCRPAEG